MESVYLLPASRYSPSERGESDRTRSSKERLDGDEGAAVGKVYVDV